MERGNFMKPLIYVVGFGPGDRPYMTQQAIDAVTQADLVVGYTTYIRLLEEQFPELRYYATPMRKETDRCRAAVEAALTGKTVALVSSGDSGIYGMAGVLLEIAAEMQADVEIIAVPGVTAASAAAAVLGAPLMHDFAVISLSDCMTPLELIWRRVSLAAEMEEGNFRYIATRIRFAEEEAAYYELALTGTEDLSDWKNFDYIGFAVDAGLATVADVKVRDAYCKFESDWYEKNPEGNIYDDFFADIFAESYEAAPRFQREGGDWINFTIPGTSYRLPMIQSGFGDGCYPVYFGYDRAGNLCRMVMEYICCEAEEEYTPEEEAYFDKNRPFLEQIAEWYVDDEPQKVIKAITSLPEEEKTDLLMGELAVAYNNTEQYEKALEILEERMDRNRENYEWHYRLGFALYYCAEEEEDVKKAENLSRRAEEEFRCALALKPSPAFKAECKEFLAWIKEDFSSYEKGIKPAKRE